MGETYILGDSPLVLLTALQSGFEADACSSHYVNISRPEIKRTEITKTNPESLLSEYMIALTAD
jgi:hypothetical protein